MLNSIGRPAAWAVGMLVFAAVAVPAQAQRASAQQQRQDQMAQIPQCASPLGTISVIEPGDGTHWWTGQQLPAPSALTKAFAGKSRCFTLVGPGAGLPSPRAARALGAAV